MDNETKRIIERIEYEQRGIKLAYKLIESQCSIIEELKAKLPKLFYAEATARSIQHGYIIHVGTRDKCIERLLELYPDGQMINDSQFDNDEIANGMSIVLGLIKGCTIVDKKDWDICQKWLKDPNSITVKDMLDKSDK